MNYLIKLLVAMALAMAGLQAQALTIGQDCVTGGGETIECWTGSETTPNVINGLVSMMFPDATELYRADIGSEDKLLAGSYETTFYEPPFFNGVNASIKYGSGESINCPACYLLVKDGDASPGWYLFDIGNLNLPWNGTDAIDLKDFVSISQVSLYGGPPGTPAPAPGPLGLLIMGLLLSGMRRLKES